MISATRGEYAPPRDFVDQEQQLRRARQNTERLHLRLPMPFDLLQLAGNPSEFRISYEEGKFILVPQKGRVVDSVRLQKARTCRVCGSEIPGGKFICPNCGSTV